MLLKLLAKNKKSLTLGMGLTLASFFILKLIFRFPFSTDDYWYLWNVASGNMSLNVHGPYMARVPLWCLFTFINFSSGFANLENLIYLLGFGINALGLTAMALGMRSAFSKQEAVSPLFICLCAIFAYFPNDHEVIFWPSCLPYMGGLPLLVLGWMTAKPALKVLLYTASFCFGEMFILPALALETFRYFFNAPGERDIWDLLKSEAGPSGRFARTLINDRKSFARKGLLWFLSVVLFLSVRKLLSFKFGSYPHTMTSGISEIPRQIQDMFDHFFVMSYYKTFWPPTLLYWLGGIIALSLGIRRQHIRWRQLLNALCFVFLSGSLVFAMGYFAPRALYGASICVNALAIVLMEQALIGVERSKKILVTSLIACAFLGQSILIYDLKDKNAHIMESKEREIVEYLVHCGNACSIDVNAVASGLKRGWVMHPDYVKPFVLWVAARHGIQRNISFHAGRP